VFESAKKAAPALLPSSENNKNGKVSSQSGTTRALTLVQVPLELSVALNKWSMILCNVCAYMIQHYVKSDAQ
jgi:hypothetical protein